HAAQREQIREQQEVARERDGRGEPRGGDQEQREGARNRGEQRPGAEHPRRVPAVDRALAQQPGEVTVTLEQRRALPPDRPRLELRDQAAEQRRGGEAEQRRQQCGGVHLALPNSTSSSTSSAAKM